MPNLYKPTVNARLSKTPTVTTPLVKTNVVRVLLDPFDSPGTCKSTAALVEEGSAREVRLGTTRPGAAVARAGNCRRIALGILSQRNPLTGPSVVAVVDLPTIPSLALLVLILPLVAALS
jgi:hypothetical protein